MRELTHTIAGDHVRIHVLTDDADWDVFIDWLRDKPRAVLCYDTETTGLHVFGNAFRIRLIQIGDAMDAWVFDSARWGRRLVDVFIAHDRWTAHNHSYDDQALDKVLGLTLEQMASRVADTQIMSKMVNPHRPSGHGLKSLASQHVDATAPDTSEGLTAEFRRLGFTKATGWAGIPLDNELYLLYAGLDVILGSRLYVVLEELVKEHALEELTTFEHTVQNCLNLMRRRGLRVDLPYLDGAYDHYTDEAEAWTIRAHEFGLDNLNSPQQVSRALIASGAVLTDRTDSGAFKVDKAVLLPLAGMDEYWEKIEGVEPNPLAYAIAMGKRSERWANAYLGQFRDLADPAGRIHPDIVGLQARTSRMAVSKPPLQQLPSSDWSIRRAILAEPGERIISADYAQIELRVVAALADIKNMKKAIASGEDLHDFTARLAYGDEFTKENRKHMKGAGFGIVYGGGATGLSRKLGLTLAQAKNVVSTYNRVYPEIKRYAARLKADAFRNKMVLRSSTGRLLPLDRDRIYAAINYQVQSLAADILKQALLNLFDQGLGEYLLMPVHDEMIASAPAAEAEDVARAIGEAMSMPLGDTGIPLDAEGEVTGDNWGAAYGGPKIAGPDDASLLAGTVG